MLVLDMGAGWELVDRCRARFDQVLGTLNCFVLEWSNQQEKWRDDSKTSEGQIEELLCAGIK